MKKFVFAFVLILLAAAAGVFFAANALSRQAPELLKNTIEHALHKKAAIKAVHYRFPGIFKIDGFELREKDGPYENQISFSADHILLNVSWYGFLNKTLVLNKVQVEDASVMIRKDHQKIYQPFSDAVAPEGQKGPVAEPATKASSRPSIPLEIRSLILKDSNFKFFDYDIQEQGFLTMLSHINVTIKDLAFPRASWKRTFYTAEGSLFQGPNDSAAAAKLSGATKFATLDTDASFEVSGLHLPFFAPYYAQVTPAVIQEGFLDVKASLKIADKKLMSIADFKADRLLFDTTPGMDNRLLGIKIDDLLPFLRDSSNQLRFEAVVEWNMADRSQTLKQVIRRSLEKSLKKTVIGNVGNIITNTIQKIGGGTLGQTKGNLEGKIKKITDLFR